MRDDEDMVSSITSKCQQRMDTDGRGALCKSLLWMLRVACRLDHVRANHVELVLLLVEIPETEPERNTCDKGNDSGGTVVPWISTTGLNEHQNTLNKSQ